MLRNNNTGDRLIRIFLSALIFCFFTIFGCQEDNDIFKDKKRNLISDAKSTVRSVTVDELSEMMENGEDLTIVDIRTKDEYTQGHLKGSVWIARGMLKFKAGKDALKKLDKKYVLYCRVDSRSALAGKTLIELGYTDVYNLKGGFSDWCDAGYSIYNRHGEMIAKSFERDETDK